jgi:hypothetical protein
VALALIVIIGMTQHKPAEISLDTSPENT